MSFIKEFMSGIIKKFEIFQTFFNNIDDNLDYKTRIDEHEIDDMSYLHILHDYWKENWILNDDDETGYISPLYNYLQRKKALRVSRDGRGRLEMENILKETLEDNKDSKTSWDKLMGVP